MRPVTFEDLLVVQVDNCVRYNQREKDDPYYADGVYYIKQCSKLQDAWKEKWDHLLLKVAAQTSVYFEVPKVRKQSKNSDGGADGGGGGGGGGTSGRVGFTLGGSRVDGDGAEGQLLWRGDGGLVARAVARRVERAEAVAPPPNLSRVEQVSQPASQPVVCLALSACGFTHGCVRRSADLDGPAPQWRWSGGGEHTPNSRRGRRRSCGGVISCGTGDWIEDRIEDCGVAIVENYCCLLYYRYCGKLLLSIVYSRNNGSH
jgi:hypothetical protein